MKNKKIAIVFLIIVNVYLLSYLVQSNKTTFYFPTVGNADASIIKTTANQVILIDAGKDRQILNSLGKELPFWKREIDLLIMSHAHNDHYGGISDVLKRYRVRYFVWNGIGSDTQQFISLLEEIKKSKVQQVVIYEGVEIKLNHKEKIETYWPPKDNNSRDLNNTSLIQKYLLGYKGIALFTGDVNAKILQNVPAKIEANILKVPHHGSKYGLNEKVISEISPNFAIIPTGKNFYGHPSKDILKLLEQSGSQIYITRDGSVKISCQFNGYCYN